MFKSTIIDPVFPNCPIRNVLSRISDRWTILIMLTLEGEDKPMRYSDLLSKIPDISQKMLTVALRNFEADGLVFRQAYAEIPPRVEYSLTERARTLLPHISSLVNWAAENLDDILKDRQAFASRK
ncbi:MAG: helix-turn-helix transcriptional regulator [Muribaculaceae bacterium]|nr:helix-turn-helix transcriptional regulator [Muribaculaceae bacterium]